MERSRRDWIEQCISKLCEIGGFGDSGQFRSDSGCFPLFFKGKTGAADDLVSDFKKLLTIEDAAIAIKSSNEVEDKNGHLNVESGETPSYTITISENILNDDLELIAAVTPAMISVCLAEKGIILSEQTEPEHFVQAATVFGGFGLISLKSSEHRLPALSKEDIAYILTLNALRINDFYPDWLSEIPNPIRKAYAEIMEETLEHFSEEEIHPPGMEAFATAEELFGQGEYRAAIDTMSEFVKSAQGEPIVADAYNNMGFYSVNILDWDAAEYYFEKALAIDPAFVLVYDNLAFARILAKEWKQAEVALKKAASAKEQDPSIHHRNLAVWNLVKGNMKEALHHFELAYSEENNVQLLDYFYSRYLKKMGEEEAANDIFEEISPYENPELIAWLETWDI